MLVASLGQLCASHDYLHKSQSLNVIRLKNLKHPSYRKNIIASTLSQEFHIYSILTGYTWSLSPGNTSEPSGGGTRLFEFALHLHGLA